MRIGRDPTAEVPIDDDTVSRQHARLHVDGDRLWLEDCGSGNGTFVSGERLEPGVRVPIELDTGIRFGAITGVIARGAALALEPVELIGTGEVADVFERAFRLASGDLGVADHRRGGQRAASSGPGDPRALAAGRAQAGRDHLRGNRGRLSTSQRRSPTTPGRCFSPRSTSSRSDSRRPCCRRSIGRIDRG